MNWTPYINIVDIFETLRENTMNAETPFKDLYLNMDILLPMIFSIVFHSVLYVLVIFTTYKTILKPKKIDYSIFKRMFIYLLFIMTIGYPLRLWRVKSVCENKDNRDGDGDCYAIQLAYTKWYFFG